MSGRIPGAGIIERHSGGSVAGGAQGESAINRDKMERMVGHMRKHGGMDEASARKVARGCALRQDGHLPGGTTRNR